MDDQDGPESPVWRPTSSLSSRVPSTSSIFRHPLSIVSPVEHQTMSSSSGYISMPAASHAEIADNGHNIVPYEPVACEWLNDEIRSFFQPGYGGIDKPAVFEAHSLESAIGQATIAVRYNAKWFAPAPLAELLTTTYQAAGTSSSSAVLYAALELLDTVLVYSVLPQHECLHETVWFIARTYYSASRARKTKSLYKRSWAVVLHLLHSHLGHRFLWALHDMLERADSFQSKEGFADVVGALLLIKKLLRSKEAHLPDVNVTILVLQLSKAALIGSSIVREHIMDVLSQILSETKPIQQLRLDAGWNCLLDTIQNCISGCSDLTVARALVSSLAPWLTHMEQGNLRQAAQLLTQVGLPLDKELSEELLAPWTALTPITEWIKEFDGMLKTLACNALYMRELSKLVDKSVIVYQISSACPEKALLIQGLQDGILMNATTAEGAETIASALVSIFEYGLLTNADVQEIEIVFDALRKTSRYSTTAANLLFRIRKDVTAALYLRPGPGKLDFVEILGPLAMENWLTTVCDTIRAGAGHWGVYEYFLQKTKYLLGNHTMFSDHLPTIRKLLEEISDIIQSDAYIEPPASTGLTKSHVAAHLVEILTGVLGYHRRLTKQEVLNLVSILDTTAGSRDYIVSTQCIHAITVCCYEVPDVMSSHMDGIINRMSRMVTQRYLAIHVLHFLAGLSRLPDLCRNFMQADYMRIFGVCHSYLQSIRGAHAADVRSQTPVSSDRSSTTRNEEALPEYVYALAHHVITFWYMCLKKQDREALKPFITNLLTYKDAAGNDNIEDQGLVTFDMMDRIDAESGSSSWHLGDENEDESSSNIRNVPDAFTAVDGQITETHRLVGLLLITTRTSLRTGKSLVVVQRPSGTAWRLHEKGQAHVTVDGDDADRIAVWPTDEEGRTYGTVSIPKSSSPLGSDTIITLPQNDAVRRAIDALVRTSALDSHKAGVIYIGERQSTEDRILRNMSGSPDYRELLSGLGSVQRLKGAVFNTQGLDRADDTDGEFAIVWHNTTTELVFHVTTLMPNSDDLSQNVAKKKRHIGNDHVNIVFNNSGRQLDYEAMYNMFPGQLTYVYIVITPSARTSFVEARTQNISTDKEDRFYSVEVVTRPDYPNVSPAAQEKMVSGASLPGFVRNLALNDCIISLMWTPRNDSSEYPSSWRSRLHQLRRLGERYGSKKA